jgi:hypothetical protein
LRKRFTKNFFEVYIPLLEIISVEHLNTKNHPETILKTFKHYLKDFIYEIEYFFEGYGIFLSNIEDPSHRIVIFFDFESKSFSITTFFSNKLNLKTEGILNKGDLSKLLLKCILQLDKLDNLRNFNK